MKNFAKYYQSNKSVKKVTSTNKYLKGKSITQSRKLSHNHLINLRAQRYKLVLRLFFVVSIIGSIIFLLFQLINNPVVIVNYNQVNYPNHQLNKLYQSQISKYLDNYPAERLKIFLDQTNLTQFVATDNPEVKSVKLVKTSPFFGSDQFIVDLRQPVAMLTVAGRQIYVDNDGVSFTNHKFDQPKIKVVDKAGVKIDQKTSLVSRSLIEFVGRSINLFEEANYQVEQVIIPPNTIHQVEFRIKDYKFPIKFTLDNSSAAQVSGTIKVLKHLKKHHQTVKYLDSRVPGKVFYQ